MDPQFINPEIEYLSDETDELYDLETDPQELHNVIDEHPEVLDHMRPYSFRH